MARNPTYLCGLLAALMLLVLAAPARADAPVVGPQWTASFWRDVPAQDAMASSSAPTWLRAPDGSTVLFTTPGGLWFRRFDPAGTVTEFARLTPQQAGIPASDLGDVLIEADPVDGGFHLLVNAGPAHHGCWLVHVDARFRVQWSIDVPGATIYPEPCAGLDVLPDGSALVLRLSTLARIGRDGQTLWSRGSPDGENLGARAFAVDAQDVVWVVGRDDTHARVSRFDIDGTPLSSDRFLCASCGFSTAEAVDVLPDGDVLVGGGSGSAQPGFLVRYDASGARRLWVDTEIDVHYSRITHDGSGAVYIGAGGLYGGETRAIRRVDPASGAVLWAIEADGFGAAAQGIVTLHELATGVTAIGIDASGAQTWTTQVSPYPSATFSRPFARDGGLVELLVQEPYAAATPACGHSPRLLTLDAAGLIVGELQACTQPSSMWLWGIGALPGVGVLANIESELVAFDPAGDERWRVVACTTCMDSLANHWVTAALTADGGAWAVRSMDTADGITTTIERIASDGQIAFTVPSAGGAWGPWSQFEMRLFVEPDRVIALTAGTRRLVWQAVGTDGSPLGTHDVPMPDDNFDIRNARLNADGSLTIVALGEIFCSVGCNPFHLSLLRITAEGSLAWQHDHYYVDWPAMPMPDGGALMASIDATGTTLQMQRFDAQGQALAPIALVDVAFGAPEAVSGPVDGRWLLQTRSYASGESTLWSIDENGEVGASRFDAWSSPHAFGSSGYLLPMMTPTGVRMQVIDATTLETRATLPFGTSGDEGFDYGPWYWRTLDDGSVYGTWLSPINRTGLARYALPWGTPQDRLFRNGFD